MLSNSREKLVFHNNVRWCSLDWDRRVQCAFVDMECALYAIEFGMQSNASMHHVTGDDGLNFHTACPIPTSRTTFRYEL